jgi:hypothetical protein
MAADTAVHLDGPPRDARPGHFEAVHSDPVAAGGDVEDYGDDYQRVSNSGFQYRLVDRDLYVLNDVVAVAFGVSKEVNANANGTTNVFGKVEGGIDSQAQGNVKITGELKSSSGNGLPSVTIRLVKFDARDFAVEVKWTTTNGKTRLEINGEREVEAEVAKRLTPAALDLFFNKVKNL